jgi:hypothetical protein
MSIFPILPTPNQTALRAILATLYASIGGYYIPCSVGVPFLGPIGINEAEDVTDAQEGAVT